MDKKTGIMVSVIAVISVISVMVISGVIPVNQLSVVGVGSVECHDQYVRVTISGENEIEDIENCDTFGHNSVHDCGTWDFVGYGEVEPEIWSVSVCGHPVEQYFRAYNWYHSGINPGWYTLIEFKDSASKSAFYSYMYDTLQYDNHDRCAWNKEVIFDSRECTSDEECPEDEWIGDTYCGN